MLLEHNKIVYEKLESILSTSNCACVIMGTGVGKSYVALEYLTQHNFKALVVSPRKSINKSWSKLCGDIVDTVTYQKLKNIYKDIDYSYYDVIICDEVHHVGAPTWGRPIMFLIDHGHRVIGLTESSVRYTDGGRDVALEFFQGNVVLGETVESAIKKDILNPVTYVGAMYNSDGLKKTIRGKIQSRLYAKLNLAINKTPTVSEILKKNMPSGKRKGIIFASTIDDIQFAIDFFHSIYPDVDVRFIHSKRPALHNAEVMDWFKNTDEGYICSVDMISEGVHIKGVNTLIMLRRTESVNLFNQQLGRCLDANTKEPAIIFDLVNNKYSLKMLSRKQREKGNSLLASSFVNASPSEQLIIKDYTKDIVDVLIEIQQSLSVRWSDADVALMREYYVSEGTFIARRLSKPYSAMAIINKAQDLGLVFDKGYWTDEEKNIINTYYPTYGFTYVCNLLPGRTKSAVRGYINAHKIHKIDPHHIVWSESEIAIVNKYYPLEGYDVLKRLPGRTYSMLKRYVNTHKVRRKPSDWTPEEDAIIVKYLYKEPISDTMARLPFRSYAAIKIRGHKLNIFKNKKRD